MPAWRLLADAGTVAFSTTPDRPGMILNPGRGRVAHLGALRSQGTTFRT